jgi:hypothetical protein
MVIELTKNTSGQEVVIPVDTFLMRKTSMATVMITLMTHIHHTHVTVGATKQTETHPRLPPPPLVPEVQQRCSSQVTDAMMSVPGPNDKLTMT